MVKIECKDYEAMSKMAAEFVANEVNGKANFILGLPTGSTPIGMYKNLTSMANDGSIDFSKTTFFNLDEYYPIAKSHPESYAFFMNKNLFGNINVDKSKVNIPNGEATDAAAECAAYDKKIADLGGIDLMVVGIGVNGHIGFNEPAAELNYATHMCSLTESTIEANARFFPSKDEVPKNALTMGMGSIFMAKKILMLISGENKKPITEQMFNGKITTDVPASLLQLHHDVTVMVC